jgi:hypothetical protein
MNAHDPEFNWQPSEEQLSAYVDGELDQADVVRVEAWLTDHPEAARDVDQYRRLSAAVRATSAPLPTEEAWRKTWEGIEARQTPAADPARGRRFPWKKFALGALAAAAALLVVLLLNQGTPHTPQHEHDGEESEAPFVLATDDDVHIESLHDDDVPALLVGQPPLPEPLTLAASEDIKLIDLQPDDDGRLPDMRWFKSGPAPMIIAPLEPAPKEEN